MQKQISYCSKKYGELNSILYPLEVTSITFSGIDRPFISNEICWKIRIMFFNRLFLFSFSKAITFKKSFFKLANLVTGKAFRKLPQLDFNNTSNVILDSFVETEEDHYSRNEFQCNNEECELCLLRAKKSQKKITLGLPLGDIFWPLRGNPGTYITVSDYDYAWIFPAIMICH